MTFMLWSCELGEHQLNRTAQQASKFLHEASEVFGLRSAEERHRPLDRLATVDLRIPQPVRLEQPLDLRSLGFEHRVTGQQLSGRLCSRCPLLFSFDLAALDEQRLGADVEVDESILGQGFRASEDEPRRETCNE